MDKNGHIGNQNEVSMSKIIPVTDTEDRLFSSIDEESKNTPKEIIPDCFKKIVQANPHFPVLKYKSDPKGNFDITVTLEEYQHQIYNAARSFIKLGLTPRATIGIMGFNHPAWFIGEAGAIFAGYMACGIYTTNSVDICKYIMNDCKMQAVIVETDEQLEKLISILPELPNLKAFIKYTGNIKEETKQKCTIPIYTWTQFLNIKSSDVKNELEQRIMNMKSTDCIMLIYTSGTTGFPKGVMLSHDNLIFTLKMSVKQMNIEPFKHTLISYLPLSHIAANLIDIISTIIFGTTVYFAQPDALKGSLGKTLKEVRPTFFVGVPRVFEKIQEQMQEIGTKAGGPKKVIAAWAKSVGYRNTISILSGKSPSLSFHVANCIVFSRVKKALGLDKCTYLASAAAPLAQKTLDYFLSLNILIHQIYGMSESSGPHTIGTTNKLKLGSAGILLKGTELKIAQPDENNIGEICMRGRNVFMGYYNAEEKTKETIDSEGWLHSGDLGKMDNDQFLFITGRIKELIITAGGENIAPVPIEDLIKERLPFVSNAMLVGDRQKFISCLLTLKTVVDPATQCPTDLLTPAAIRSFDAIGIQVTTVKEVRESKNPLLNAFIDKEIKSVNALSISRAAYVQKWYILPKDFSIYGKELGPTLKLKRMVIIDIYSEIIKSLYES